jgi:predicted AAA+ superfamily ATPase
MATAQIRYLTMQVQRDLRKKMVFLAGARQVGKTTLARSLPGATRGYMSWDAIEDREKLLRREMPPSPLWILDEIHKYRQWRGLVKGLFDKREPGQRILVTGSAKLDFYRYGGDSLQGRYHLLRLHPLSAAELGLETVADLKQLLALGGFPEPFFGGSLVEARRWSREYRARLVREDIASLERVQDLGQLELLAQRLPALVGSPLSVNALREDLQVSHPTVESWLGALERTYAIFRLLALGLPRVRAVKKQRKHYQTDWSVVPDAAARFENLVASHLLKWVQFEEDTQGRDLELRYFRDRDGREVDFVVTEDRRPILLVEAKLSDTDVDQSLRYLLARCPGATAWQVSATGKKNYRTPEGVRVAPVMELLKTLI